MFVGLILLASSSTLHAANVITIWDANTEPDIAGYKLSYGTQSGVYSTTVDVGNVITYTVTGLSAGQRYFFAVQAYNTSALVSPYSNEVIFDVPASPAITTLSPSSGPIATPVTISGSGFGATRGSSTVTFNGASATPTSWSATSIVVPVPAGATTGNVVVTVGGVASNGVSFTVTVPPTISGLSPPSGPVSTAVTITGTNFGATRGSSTVTFNGVSATPTSWSASSIVVPVPTGATTGNVVVTVGGQASNGVSFTVTVSPAITSLSPATGTIGTVVTIAGTNFGASQGASTVTFNGVAATPSSWSATSIVVTVPTGATRGNVVVTVNGTASNGVLFQVVPRAPTGLRVSGS